MARRHSGQRRGATRGDRAVTDATDGPHAPRAPSDAGGAASAVPGPTPRDDPSSEPWRPRNAEFAALLQHAPIAMAVVTGEAHTLVAANEAFLALSARSADASGPPLLGTPAARAFVDAIRPALAAVLNGVRASGRPGRTVLVDPAFPDTWACTAWPAAWPAPSRTATTRRRAPGNRWFADLPGDDGGTSSETSAAAIVVAVDAAPAPARPRIEHRDVTERVLLNALREEDRADVADAARAVAEASNAARAQFLAATSHELRTPLQAIGGYADLLEMGFRGPVTEGQRDALGRIQAAMQHLLGLTTTLLDHAQIEAGRLEYDIGDVPVAAALRDAAALVAPQAGAKGVGVVVAAREAGLAVRADAGKLRQILVNLLANAVKFTAAGGTVTASGAAADAATARVHLTVVDTGCGIAADQLATVFDPYVQVGRRMTTRDAGVGLGLAISRDLARGMAGDLTAASAVGVGSAFTVTLPQVSPL